MPAIPVALSDDAPPPPPSSAPGLPAGIPAGYMNLSAIRLDEEQGLGAAREETLAPLPSRAAPSASWFDE